MARSSVRPAGRPVVAAVAALVLGSTVLPSAQAPTDVAALRARAEAGDPAAQTELGTRLYNGQGVTRDETEAARWTRLAADQGHAPAEYNLGLMYFRGRGVAVDEQAAATWYRRAADRGFPPAQAALGYMYEYGAGVARDLVEALMWVGLATDGAMNDVVAGLYRQKRDEIAAMLTEAEVAESDRRRAAWRPER